MSGKNGKATATVEKAKAQRFDITQLVITSAYARTFKSGKTGFFGKGMNPQNGDTFQIIGAVKIG